MPLSKVLLGIAESRSKLAQSYFHFVRTQSGRQDSNPRPSAPKARGTDIAITGFSSHINRKNNFFLSVQDP